MGKRIILKTEAEIRILREANQIVAATLAMLREKVAPGVTTWQLDSWAEDFCVKRGSTPAFKGYRGFPGSLCVSVNHEVVHGIPSKKVVLLDGDIVSIDFGVRYEGYYGDAAITVAVGPISDKSAELLRVTRESLDKGIAKARIGNRINDISGAIQDHVEKHGFSVVRQFVGHGIGVRLHEPPEIPNYRRNEPTPRLLAGMVLAIEPMVNAGGFDVEVLRDGWTVVTRDRALSAHFEHTVAVTEGTPYILSQSPM
ncbi:MAG: type I methionyl aminopeptidase [Desulfobacterales bacterium CG2_30_60_27]|nr:MAG: type I methionyl aminopeptidase [Desulfobacterales bacterium CG2_30_60_27]